MPHTRTGPGSAQAPPASPEEEAGCHHCHTDTPTLRGMWATRGLTGLGRWERSSWERAQGIGGQKKRHHQNRLVAMWWKSEEVVGIHCWGGWFVAGWPGGGGGESESEARELRVILMFPSATVLLLLTPDLMLVCMEVMRIDRGWGPSRRGE